MVKKKTVTVTGKRQITLPVDFCRESGIEAGQKLEATFDSGEIRLKSTTQTKPVEQCTGFLSLIGAGSGTTDKQSRSDDQVIAAEADPRTRDKK